jgi:hypothetical protein
MLSDDRRARTSIVAVLLPHRRMIMASQPSPEIPTDAPIDDPIPTPTDPIPPTPSDPVVGSPNPYTEGP